MIKRWWRNLYQGRKNKFLALVWKDITDIKLKLFIPLQNRVYDAERRMDMIEMDIKQIKKYVSDTYELKKRCSDLEREVKSLRAELRYGRGKNRVRNQ